MRKGCRAGDRQHPLGAGDLVAWEIVQVLKTWDPTHPGSWPVSLFEVLLLLTVMPALTAFAFVRLYLAVVQSGYGSLNTYTLTSSPWAWALLDGPGQSPWWDRGRTSWPNTLNAALPEVVRRGEFGAKPSSSTKHWVTGSSVDRLLPDHPGGPRPRTGATHRAVGGDRAVARRSGR